jgi:hypothetical protein
MGNFNPWPTRRAIGAKPGDSHMADYNYFCVIAYLKNRNSQPKPYVFGSIYGRTDAEKLCRELEKSGASIAVVFPLIDTSKLESTYDLLPVIDDENATSKSVLSMDCVTLK